MADLPPRGRASGAALRRELVMLDLTDLGPNPHVAGYGNYGGLTVRWAKGTKGSGPRRRTG